MSENTYILYILNTHYKVNILKIMATPLDYVAYINSKCIFCKESYKSSLSMEKQFKWHVSTKAWAYPEVFGFFRKKNGKKRFLHPLSFFFGKYDF